MTKCDFNKVAGCSLVNLLYIFRAPFLKNTSGRLLLDLLKLFTLQVQKILIHLLCHMKDDVALITF